MKLIINQFNVSKKYKYVLLCVVYNLFNSNKNKNNNSNVLKDTIKHVIVKYLETIYIIFIFSSK
jgi:hypothetical protein